MLARLGLDLDYTGRSGAGLYGHTNSLTYGALVQVFLIGLIQSFFEGAMYTFVILWVPTLASMVPGGKLDQKGNPVKDFGTFGPGQGWVFAAMMLCISLGGQVCSYVRLFVC